MSRRGPLRKIVGVVDVESSTRPGRWRKREVLECGHLHRADQVTPLGRRRRCSGCYFDKPVRWNVEKWEEA